MVEPFYPRERHGICVVEAGGGEEHCDGEHGEDVELVVVMSQRVNMIPERRHLF